jgi:hypothetical protein
MPTPFPSPGQRRSAFVRSILATKGLSLAEACRRSHALFKTNRRLWLSPGFYDELQHASFSPSLEQLYSLSAVTGYRLNDWLKIFRFSFDEAARLQLAWPAHQTCELDAFLYDTRAEVEWFEESGPMELGNDIEPLSQWLSGKITGSLDSLADNLNSEFRYLKIGRSDAYAYPELLPDSVVRVDPRITVESARDAANCERIYAIEHSRGIVCGRLRPGSNGRVTLCPKVIPYPPIEIRLGREARLIGLVDFEFRSLASVTPPSVAPKAARVWIPAALGSIGAVGQHCRRARIHSGLSFQGASERTKHVARLLGDKRYFCAPSALSDMEARDLLPRHIHKLIAVGAAYCLSLNDLLKAIGMPLERTGREPMPLRWFKNSRGSDSAIRHDQARFLRIVESRVEAVPFFLRHGLRSLTGKVGISVRDLFWAGRTEEWNHPYLRNAAFLAVNRRSKTPAPLLSSPVWAQPLYLLALRNGSYLCAACTLDGDTLVIRPWTASSQKIVQLKNREEVEVVGKIVAVARRLLYPSEPSST